jgi:hypothetical protein
MHPTAVGPSRGWGREGVANSRQQNAIGLAYREVPRKQTPKALDRRLQLGNGALGSWEKGTEQHPYAVEQTTILGRRWEQNPGH